MTGPSGGIIVTGQSYVIWSDGGSWRWCPTVPAWLSQHPGMDRVFTLATAEGKLADLIRTRVVPVVLPTAAKFEGWREWVFRTVSQITINYRGGPLSTGEAGDVHGGNRLPWAPIDGIDNYELLSAMTWQVHVYGRASSDLISWCSRSKVARRLLSYSVVVESGAIAYVRVTPIAGCAVQLLKSSRTPTL